MAYKWPDLDPNEIQAYSVDWSRFLNTGDTIPKGPAGHGAEPTLAPGRGFLPDPRGATEPEPGPPPHLQRHGPVLKGVL